MKQLAKRVIVAGMALTLLTAPMVSAHEGHDHGDKPTSDGSTSSHHAGKAPDAEQRVDEFRKAIDKRLQTIREERMGVAEDAKTQARERLDSAKKKVCDKHQSQVNKLISTMNARRQAAFDRITQVSDAVQKYYTNHSLEVANYDDLVATVSAAKAAAQESIVNQRSVPKLDCKGTGPRADMEDFKAKRADSIDAIKEYRNAVKELVHAVRETGKEV